MGAAFGVAEGITSRITSHVPDGAVLGAAVGLVGGAAGAVAGQAALWIFGGLVLRTYEGFQWAVLPVSRAVGWAVIGVFVSVGEGVRALSPKRIVVGLIGGFIGGLIGGLLLEYCGLLLPARVFPRLIGLAALGLSIALLHGLIESGVSFGTLRVLTGALRGKEFLINQGRMRIAKSHGAEIWLPDLEDVTVELRVRQGEVFLRNLSPEAPLLINEQHVHEQQLVTGDVVRVGSTAFYYIAYP